MSLNEGVTLNSDFQNIITKRLKFKTDNNELSQPIWNRVQCGLELTSEAVKRTDK